MTGVTSCQVTLRIIIVLSVMLCFLLVRDKRETSSQTEYMLSDVKGKILCRHPGTVDGQPVTIQKCQVSYLLLCSIDVHHVMLPHFSVTQQMCCSDVTRISFLGYKLN